MTILFTFRLRWLALWLSIEFSWLNWKKTQETVTATSQNFSVDICIFGWWPRGLAISNLAGWLQSIVSGFLILGCTRLPRPPADSRLKCNPLSGCTATCKHGYSFPDGRYKEDFLKKIILVNLANFRKIMYIEFINFLQVYC